MKLPDFREYDRFIKLRQKMGIENSARSSFKFKLNWDCITSSELEVLNKSGLKVKGFNDITFLKDGTISYKNTRVLIHLSEWRPDQELDSSHSFHFSECRTVVKMRELGRSQRYVVSTRKDGKFKYKLIQNDNSEILKEDKLNVCTKCLSQLNYHNYGYDITPLEQKKRAFKKFNLNEFFIRFSCSPANNNVNIAKPEKGFKDNWDKKHLEQLKRSHWKCFSCNNDFSDNWKKYLHTHHKDGDPYNNEDSNIEVLCNKCHAAKQNHFHLKCGSK